MRIIDWSSDVCSSDLSAVKVADGDYRIVFTAEETNKAIQITGDSGATLAALNVSADNGATFSTELQPHQPARLYLDGIITVIERDTNEIDEIGRAHVCTPVTNAHLVCRLLLEKKTKTKTQRALIPTSHTLSA